jgi:eukaryotic-like serine/threonine-protein kinase
MMPAAFVAPCAPSHKTRLAEAVRGFPRQARRGFASIRELNHRLYDRLRRRDDAVATIPPASICRLPDEPASGPDLCFGPYRIVDWVGTGGMSVVFRAVHVPSGRAAALKVLPLAWGADPELRQRLAYEAAALERIDHPNVRRVLQTGEVTDRPDGGYYLAMEWHPYALHNVLRARHPEPLPPNSALGIARGVAQGLSAAHDAGVLHRDVKPSNVLLRVDGTPVLTDFGLARLVGETFLDRRLTPSNVIVGTADYISPEQVAGEPVDGRSDLYSLGVVLYEMLAGHLPFESRRPLEMLRAHVEEPPLPLPTTVPPAARAILEQGLQKRPEARFATAAVMAGALAGAQASLFGVPGEQGGREDEQTDGFHYGFGLAPSAGGLEPSLSLSRGG